MAGPLGTAGSLPAALHPASRRRSCLPLPDAMSASDSIFHRLVSSVSHTHVAVGNAHGPRPHRKFPALSGRAPPWRGRPLHDLGLPFQGAEVAGGWGSAGGARGDEGIRPSACDRVRSVALEVANSLRSDQVPPRQEETEAALNPAFVSVRDVPRRLSRQRPTEASGWRSHHRHATAWKAWSATRTGSRTLTSATVVTWRGISPHHPPPYARQFRGWTVPGWACAGSTGSAARSCGRGWVPRH